MNEINVADPAFEKNIKMYYMNFWCLFKPFP